MSVFLTVFFNCSGMVHQESLSQRRTVVKEYYLEVIRRLRESIRQKRIELWKNQSWILHHATVSAHKSMIVREFLVQNSNVIMPQPPYSPNLAHADIFLFLKPFEDTDERKVFCYD